MLSSGFGSLIHNSLLARWGGDLDVGPTWGCGLFGLAGGRGMQKLLASCLVVNATSVPKTKKKKGKKGVRNLDMGEMGLAANR